MFTLFWLAMFGRQHRVRLFCNRGKISEQLDEWMNKKKTVFNLMKAQVNETCCFQYWKCETNFRLEWTEWRTRWLNSVLFFFFFCACFLFFFWFACAKVHVHCPVHYAGIFVVHLLCCTCQVHWPVWHFDFRDLS